MNNGFCGFVDRLHNYSIMPNPPTSTSYLDASNKINVEYHCENREWNGNMNHHHNNNNIVNNIEDSRVKQVLQASGNGNGGINMTMETRNGQIIYNIEMININYIDD